MRLVISTLCYLVGAAFCFRALILFPRLARERSGPTSTGKSSWAGWMPGEFTPQGRRIRRNINLSLVAGWLALLAGLLLGRAT